MLTATYIASLLLLVFLSVQLVPALLFVRELLKPPRPLPSDEICPKAAILLSVRGADPFLPRCIEGLLTQDYPNYSVRIVVDHVEDPAWDVIHEVIGHFPDRDVVVEPLREKLGTCTLKANGLLQAATHLDASYDLVAILDADVNPHSTWLRELAEPFQDEGVVAATGSRWFMPDTPNMVELVRYAWNAGAVVFMRSLNMPWGGTMAVRGSVIRSTALDKHWRHAMASDTALDAAVRELGGRVAFVPSLVCVNRESTNFRGLWHFIRRQMLNNRFGPKDWRLLFAFGWLVLFTQAFIALAALVGLWQRDYQVVALASVTLVAFYMGGYFMSFALEFGMRKPLRTRGEPVQWLKPFTVVKLLLAIPYATLYYMLAFTSSTRMKRMTWRGVDYTVEGQVVKLVRYEPYRGSVTPAQGNLSL